MYLATAISFYFVNLSKFLYLSLPQTLNGAGAFPSFVTVAFLTGLAVGVGPFVAPGVFPKQLVQP
jgi:hypothetical protein